MPDLETVEVWAKELNIVGTRIGARFGQAEPDPIVKNKGHEPN
jgi:hypothetical protein